MKDDAVTRKAVQLLKQRGIRVDAESNLLEKILTLLETESAIAHQLSAYLPVEVVESAFRDPEKGVITGQRRRATVLFIDICGFTAFSEKSDPETVVFVLNRIFEAIIRSANRYGGTVDKFLGDAALINFGVPHAHGDDPARAVRAAVDMLLEIQSIDLQMPANDDRYEKLNVSVGINSGLLVTGNVGALSRKEWTVIGDTVNIAARLRDLAKPGEIIIGPETWEATSSEFEFQPLPVQKLKGKTSGFQAYRLVNTAYRKSHSMQLPDFYGRQSELAEFKLLFSDLLSGLPSVLQLSGSAGIGKTRLIQEWLKQDVQSEAMTVHFNAVFEDREDPFRVINRTLDTAFNWSCDVATKRKSRSIKALIRFLGGTRIDELFISHWISGLIEGRFDRAQKSDADVPQLLLEAFLLMFSLLSQKQPLVIVCDGFQWFDPVSEEIMRWIAAHLGDRRILMIITTREILPFPGRIIRLEGLKDASTTQFIAALLEHNSIKNIDPDVVQAKAGNNPLFLQLLIQHIAQRGLDLRDPNIRLPLNFHSIVQAEIDTLGPDEQKALEIMSVSGFKTQFKLIADIARFSFDRLHHISIDLINRGFIAFDASKKEFYFQQDIIRQTTYETLLTNNRALLHDQIGSWLVESRSSMEVSPETIAFHLEKGPNPAGALYYLELAAQKANAYYLYDLAIQHYSHGLKIIQSSKLSHIAEHWKFLYKIGQLYHFKGNSQDAKDTFKKALLLSKTGNIDSRHARSLVKIGDIHADQGELTESLVYYEEAMRIFHTALDQEGELQAGIALGTVFSQLGKWEEAMRFYQSALQIASDLGNPQYEGVLFSNMGILSSMQNKFEESIEYYLESLRCFEQTGLQEGVAQALHNVGMTYERVKDFDHADYYYRRSQEIALEIQDPAMVALSILNRSQVIMEKGDLGMARGLVMQAISRMSQIDNRLGLADGYLVLGKIEFRSGNFKRARGLFAVSFRLNQRLGHTLGMASSAAEYGRVLMRFGNVKKSNRYLSLAHSVYTEMRDDDSIDYIKSIWNEDVETF